MPDARWRLDWYEPLIESWQGPVYFSAPVDEMRHVFGLPPADLMREQYQVKPEHVARFRRWTDTKFEFDFYEYYLTRED
jgi:hypothetical protein